MTLEFVYWLTLSLGLGLLLLSLLVGDVLDLFDLEFGGSDFAAGPVFFAATAAFGAGGLLGVRVFEQSSGASIVTGLLTGAVFGTGTGVLFALLRRQEGEGAFDLARLVGQRAQITVAVEPGQVGRANVTFEGMTRSFAARSEESLPVGESVVVRDVIGSQITVARQAGSTEA